MKIGVAQKILSVMLSLIFLGSGLLHPIIHSGGQCSCETERKSSSATGGSLENSAAELHKAHSEDSLQSVGIFCQICAGMFNFAFSPESFRVVLHFPETVYHFFPKHPVSINDFRLPHSRAPPLS